MQAHFELENELGLDEDRKPLPSLVVNTQGKRRVQVWGKPGGWHVETDDDSVATARVLRSIGNAADIEISGHDEGFAEIRAFHGNVTATLFVRVVDAHEVSVNFHYFTAGPSQTTLTRSAAVTLLKAINKIYEPQAFVKFRLHRMDPVADDKLMALDFATEGQSQGAEKSIWDTLKAYVQSHYPMKKQRNVFFVKKWGARDRWSCAQGCGRRDVMGTNPIGGNLAIIETAFANTATRLPQLLAHELGHSLGLQHTTTLPNNLMQPHVNTSYVKLTERQARKIGKIF